MTNDSTAPSDTRCDKSHRELRVRVITTSLIFLSDPPRINVINYLDASDRKWLDGHCFWAMHNEHSVLTQPII